MHDDTSVCRFCGTTVKTLHGQVADSSNDTTCPANPAPWPKNLHSVWIASLDA